MDDRNFTLPSEGLEFILNEDGNTYTVKQGTCTDAHVVIPDTHLGKLVTSIADRAFRSCWSLTYIDLPLALKEIGRDVFKDCDRLSIQYRGTVNQWKEIKKPFKFFHTHVVECQCHSNDVL